MWTWLYDLAVKLWLVCFIYGIAWDAWTLWRRKRGLPLPGVSGWSFIGRIIDHTIDAHYVKQFRKDLRLHRHG